MSMENFISEALCKPNDYVSYWVSQRLAKIHPDKAVIEGETSLFDLEEYVRAGHCEVVSESSIHNQTTTGWDGTDKKFTREADNAWLNVFWKGHLLDVVFVKWTDDGYKSRHHWIVAEAREIAEEFLREVCEWCAEVRGEILVFEGGGWRKNKKLHEAIKAATFDNLILPRGLKEDVRNDLAHFFSSREMYERYGIPWKRGVLLLGPPGNGKTHTVKALINELKKPCLYVKTFKSRCETEQQAMREVFRRARQTAPCLLVLEDVDSLINDKNRAFFLNELDGFTDNTGVVVIATTNHPERLDPAIIDRPSRFDRKYNFDLPAPSERRAYIERWNDKLQIEMRLSEGIAERVVVETENFSFAYLKELFLSSMMQWLASAKEGGMDAVVFERVARLRGQMSNIEEPTHHVTDDDDDEDE
ncbi:MAG: ATP-binding protein [Pyrinomonadaceae bacterium]|nr:ATP-binding protein [Pyrinomonadaceae bacterium]